MSFADLKRNRRSSMSKLTEAAERLNSGGDKNYKDDRIWTLTRDKQGNGYAVIRFLPAAPDNNLPWERYWDHGFQGPTGQWYIEKSLTSIGKNDPVGELNGRLWNTGNAADKETARKQKRRLHYVANVLIINDPTNPDNNGKVKIFQFGKKIFDKLMDAMKPEYPDEEPLNPFDFWTGATFKIKARIVDGWVNYDKSEFGPVEALSDNDEELEKIYNQLYDLREFVDPSKYKTYEELQARLDAVLGAGRERPLYHQESSQMNDPQEAPEGRRQEARQPMTAEAYDDGEDDSSADEDTLSYFAKLAQNS